MQHHNWSLEEVENMMPWERDVYVQLLINWLQEENSRMEQEERRLNNS